MVHTNGVSNTQRSGARPNAPRVSGESLGGTEALTPEDSVLQPPDPTRIADRTTTGDADRNDRGDGLFKHIFGPKPAALGLLGVLAYLVLRFAYGRFYTPLGLSPDALGLGYSQLLTQSAIGVGILWIFSLLLIVIVLPLIVLFAELPSKPVEEFASDFERFLWRCAAQPRRAGSAVIAVLILLVLSWRAGRPGLAVVIPVVLICWDKYVVHGTSRIRRGLKSKWGPWVVAAVLVTAAVLTAQTLIVEAKVDAHLVMNGREADNRLLGVPVTSWGAEAATISWTTDTANIDPSLRPLDKMCVMYLGESNGTLFLYTPYGSIPGAFRVPAAVAAVRVVPGGRCRPGVATPSMP